MLAAADSIRRQLGDKYVGGEIRRQLAGADLVVMTKTDLCAEPQRQAASGAIVSVAGSAPIESVDVPVDVVLGLRPPGSLGAAPVDHDEHYLRWSWIGGVILAANVGDLLAELPGGLLRLKGWIDTGDEHLLVQVVGASTSTVQADSGARGSRLEAIALRGGFDADAFTARFDAAAD